LTSEELEAAAAETVKDETAEAVQKLEAARKERDRYKRQLGKAEEELEGLRTTLSLITRITDHVPDPPEWLAPEPSGDYHGTPLLVISDTHFDEVVRPEEFFGLNAYDRDIAELRLKKAFEGAVTLPRDYLGSSLKKDGVVLVHGGDLITGEIHDELQQTNEGTPPETVLHYLDPMLAGISLLKEEYGKVHIVVCDGNHDRFYKKKRSKRRATDSWSFLFWQLLARDCAGDDDVTFQIPEGPDTIFPVYDTRILLHHGDQQRGGGGIAGPLTPIAIGQYRKMRKHTDAIRYTGNERLRFDLTIQGHIHHRNSLPGVITVGAVKGYDEYANTGNYPFEPATAEMLVITPERGLTFQAPIYLQDPEEEGWDHRMLDLSDVPDEILV
jgi:predicted phosphodiesterase